jgi:hypothetical protein
MRTNRPKTVAWHFSARASARTHGASFDPEMLDVLGAAFNRAWQEVEAHPVDFYSKTTRQTLAKTLMRLARKGHADPATLSDLALASLRAPERSVH